MAACVAVLRQVQARKEGCAAGHEADEGGHVAPADAAALQCDVQQARVARDGVEQQAEAAAAGSWLRGGEGRR